MTKNPTLRLLLGLFAVFALLTTACGDDDDGAAAEETSDPVATDSTEDDSTEDDSAITPEPDPTVSEPVETEEPEVDFQGELVGLFAIDEGTCADGVVTGGSYFRMLQPDGATYIDNFDSACDDTTYTLLTAGADGGLTTGAHQPAPDPAFDEAGNGLAASIAAPVTFFGVDFAAATDATLDLMVITGTDGVLSGDTTSFTAFYGGAPFNQGAPKPDGSTPGLTAVPTGTIDADTGAFVLEWSSQIVGGSFNDFTGVWHLEGTFTAS